MDHSNTPTVQPVAPTESSTQDSGAVNATPQPISQPQSVVSPPITARTPRPPKKSGLKKIIIILVSIIGAVMLVGGIGFFVFLASFFHAVDSQCGVNSDTHKQEVLKVSVFNTVSVLPGRPNEPASIYDSSAGTCNLDVAQSYSATKSYTVNMDGATALSTVTDSMKKQGFKLSKQAFSYGYVTGQSSCSASIWGWANYTGKSTIITVIFGNPTQQCPNPPGTYLLSTLPSVTLTQFSSTPITSIKATVSTPDETLQVN